MISQIRSVSLHPYFIGEQCYVTDIHAEETCLQSIKGTVTQYGWLQNNIGHCWMDVTSFRATRIIWSHNTKPVYVPMCGTRIIWSGNIKLWCRCLCARWLDTHHSPIHYKTAEQYVCVCVCRIQTVVYLITGLSEWHSDESCLSWTTCTCADMLAFC